VFSQSFCGYDLKNKNKENYVISNNKKKGEKSGQLKKA
jgi:hypothetical protein